MRLEQSFDVPVPVAQAWNVLLDVERIAPCMPGATLTEFDGNAFTGVVKVKLGPVSLSYRGTGSFVERDEAARRVVIHASGQDSRGAGAAAAKVTATLHDAAGSSTRVDVVTELDIAGRAAQFGRGMIADVSGKLIKQFADCLAETIGAAAGAAAAVASSAPSEAAPAAPPPAPPPPVMPEPEPAYAAHDVMPSAETAPPAPAPSAAPPPAPPTARREAQPIDLLAVSGAKGAMRRAAPYLIVALLIAAAVVVWLVVV